MHQTMEIYMARKKRVPGYYNPDSYRVFDERVSDSSLGDTKLNKIYIETKKESRNVDPKARERRNHPHPIQTKFLRTNVRMLNEPVCVVADPRKESFPWWQSNVNDKSPAEPKKTKDTTQRVDYTEHQPIPKITRHSSNPLNSPSKGILPVALPKTTKEDGDVLLEKISYFHNYNSRKDPSEPIRGKLQGSFVWDLVVKDQNGKDVLETPWTKRDIKSAKSTAVVLAANNTTEVQDNKNTCPTDNGEKTQIATEQEKLINLSIPPIEGLPAP